MFFFLITIPHSTKEGQKCIYATVCICEGLWQISAHTKKYFKSENNRFWAENIILLEYKFEPNHLGIKYQSYPKSTKTDAFEYK